MTLRGDSTPSCSACKYRRRKCTATCPLAQYFPADKPELFLYVHRLYGVSNVAKILETLETQDQKDDAMKSIIYESEWRHRIPAYGCCFIISHLSFKLEAAKDELRHVKELLAAIRNQSNLGVDYNSCSWPSSQQEFGGNRPRIDSQDAGNHNLLSTHFEAQTSVHGIVREPEIFLPGYGDLRYSLSADDIQSYIEACEPSSKP